MRAGFLFPKCSQSGSLLEDQDEQERKRFIDSKIAQHRLEKFFPVYALGISMPDTDSFVSVFNSDDPLADPIWDAVKEEAKFEVQSTFPILFLIFIFSWVVSEGFSMLKDIFFFKCVERSFWVLLHFIWSSKNFFFLLCGIDVN
ncbi:hypothetical protein I3843_07G004200 [Carya illinoinensis]|nr:hypothetical protein I3843_07G004200 [Carya illinoinensis]